MSAPRIVSLVPSLTELVCALGRGDWLVGRTGFCVHPREALVQVPKVGGTKTVNIEKIRRLAPTHLIVNIDENEKPTVEALSEFIPNVVVTHPIAIHDNFELYQRFGRLFDAEARAAQLCAQLERALDLTQTAPRATLRVLYLIWNDPWMTVSSETFIAKMLASVGIEVCAPPGDARYPSLSSDVMGSFRADAVLLSSEPCRFRPADRRQLRAALVGGAAAQAQAQAPVLGIDGEMTSWYGPRAIEGLHYLLGYRRRLDARLERRASLRQAPLASSPGHARFARAGCTLAAAVMLGFLAACSSAPPAVPGAPAGGPAPAAEAGPSPPAAGTAPPGRGRFYLDDGPGDRPLAELQKVPDAVPRAESLHSRANRPYVIFGRQYEPMTRLEPFRERGVATWYGRRYHGRPTSIGEIYDMYRMTAAHPTLPLPSYARVTNVRTGRSVIVRVNDRGPFLHGRVIDLSYAAAAKLAAALPGSEWFRWRRCHRPVCHRCVPRRHRGRPQSRRPQRPCLRLPPWRPPGKRRPRPRHRYPMGCSLAAMCNSAPIRAAKAQKPRLPDSVRVVCPSRSRFAGMARSTSWLPGRMPSPPRRRPRSGDYALRPVSRLSSCCASRSARA